MAISRFSTSSVAQGLPKYQKLWDGTSVINNNSYESISTVTVGAGGSSTVTFSSIPGTYKNLQLRMYGATTNGTVADIYFRFNGDSGANYFCHQLRGGGSTVQGFSYTTQNQMILTSNTGQSNIDTNAAVCTIVDYASTTKNKTIRSRTGYDYGSGGESIFWSGAWNSTAAVTSINLSLSGGNFLQYSKFALYGIKG